MKLYKVGERMVHLLTGASFALSKMVKNPKTQKMFLSDGENRYPEDECTFEDWTRTVMLGSLLIHTPTAKRFMVRSLDNSIVESWTGDRYPLQECQPIVRKPFKTIIAGSRGIEDPVVVASAVWLSGFEIAEVVSGGCRGVDRMGEQFAEAAGVPVKRFPADWEAHGKAAGPLRNQEMADYADALIAIWDGESRGTKDMIDRATKSGLAIFVYRTDRSDIQTAIDLVDHILVGNESIEWLSALDQEFKGLLWLHLTEEQKDGLKRLKRQAEETIAVA